MEGGWAALRNLKELFIAKTVAPKYSPEQEAAIRAVGTMNAAKADALAVQFGKTPASVRAKAIRMGVPYERKQPVTKSGAPVEKKESIVSEIQQIVGGNLDGLDKAPKPVLQLLRDHLAA